MEEAVPRYVHVDLYRADKAEEARSCNPIRLRAAWSSRLPLADTKFDSVAIATTVGLRRPSFI
jgi:hypothetical protein